MHKPHVRDDVANFRRLIIAKLAVSIFGSVAYFRNVSLSVVETKVEYQVLHEGSGRDARMCHKEREKNRYIEKPIRLIQQNFLFGYEQIFWLTEQIVG